MNRPEVRDGADRPGGTLASATITLIAAPAPFCLIALPRSLKKRLVGEARSQ
jgi:hypothetical protein